MTQSWHRTLWENKKEVLLILFLGGVLIYFYIQFQPKPVAPPTSSARVTLELQDIIVHDYQKDHKRWLLKGKRAIVLEGSKELEIQPVQLFMYAENTDSQQKPVIEAELLAQQGRVYGDIVEVSGDVQIFRTIGNMTINTQKAFYNTNTAKLNVPGAVEIIRPEQKLWGHTLNYDLSKQEWDMKKATFLQQQ